MQSQKPDKKQITATITVLYWPLIALGKHIALNIDFSNGFKDYISWGGRPSFNADLFSYGSHCIKIPLPVVSLTEEEYQHYTSSSESVIPAEPASSRTTGLAENDFRQLSHDKSNAGAASHGFLAGIAASEYLTEAQTSTYQYFLGSQGHMNTSSESYHLLKNNCAHRAAKLLNKFSYPLKSDWWSNLTPHAVITQIYRHILDQIKLKEKMLKEQPQNKKNDRDYIQNLLFLMHWRLNIEMINYPNMALIKNLLLQIEVLQNEKDMQQLATLLEALQNKIYHSHYTSSEKDILLLFKEEIKKIIQAYPNQYTPHRNKELTNHAIANFNANYICHYQKSWLKSFNNLLINLNYLESQLNTEIKQMPVHSKKINSYLLASHALSQLRKDLYELKTPLDEKITDKDIKEFHSQALKIINAARPVLESHRGWNVIMASFTLAILTGGLSILSTGLLTNGKRWLLLFNTNTAYKIEPLEKSIEELNDSISLSNH